jgi:hypothetical protein
MSWEGALVGLLLVACGGALLWTAWSGSQRRLRRNWFIGIRTRATLRSDEAWAAAHEAAAGPLGVGGGFTALGGLAVLVSGVDDVIGVVAVTAATAAAVLSVLVGARSGVQAAREVSREG